MQTKINTEVLKSGIKQVLGATQRKNTLPILSTVLFNVNDTDVKLTATDMDIEITSNITAVKTKADGSFCVDATVFNSILSKIVSEDIELTIKENKLSVKAGGSKFNLNTIAPDDFPSMDGDCGDAFTMAASDILSMMDGTSFAASLDATRYYLNGVYFHKADGNLRAVATDGHRLAVCSGDEVKFDFPDVILPLKTINELVKLASEAGSVSVSIGKSKARFYIGDVTVTSKLIDGTFPDYVRIIPTANSNVLAGHVPTLLQAIERVVCVASDKSRCVKLDISADSLIITARSEIGDASETVGISYVGTPLTIGFNANYLVSMMKKLSDNATFEFGDTPTSPVIIKNENSDKLAFILMPMRV